MVIISMMVKFVLGKFDLLENYREYFIHKKK